VIAEGGTTFGVNRVPSCWKKSKIAEGGTTFPIVL
jgi:hypothetical protein